MNTVTGLYSGVVIGSLAMMFILIPFFVIRNRISVDRNTKLNLCAWYAAELAIASVAYVGISVVSLAI